MYKLVFLVVAVTDQQDLKAAAPVVLEAMEVVVVPPLVHVVVADLRVELLQLVAQPPRAVHHQPEALDHPVVARHEQSVVDRKDQPDQLALPDQKVLAVAEVDRVAAVVNWLGLAN